MRVATFNIRHGERAGDGVDLAQLAHDCAALHADALALQEVDCFVWRSRLRNQARVVARALGLRHVFLTASRRHWFGRFGNALLARGRIDDVERRGLPGRPGHERRAVLLARVALAGTDVSVATTHLQSRRQAGGSTAEAIAQLVAAVAELNERPAPRLLLGDLNLEPGDAEPVLAAGGLTCAPSGDTYPADQPRHRIDYVAFSDLALERVEVANAVVSDHRPLVAELV
jgi:endonuclease/exonuclease/phosphatase family metal-dependent hydrolase